MDFIRDLMHYWPLLTLCLNVIVAWAAWSMTKKFVTVDAMNQYKAEVGDRLDTLETHKDLVEERFKSLATATDIHKLEVAVTRLEGRVDGKMESLGALISRLDLQVNRLTDFHMSEGQ